MRVLITGATKGIGQAITLAFAKKQAELFLLARTEKDLLNFREQLQQQFAGLQVHCYPTDLASDESITSSIQQIKNDTDTLDVLINNAGIFRPDQILDLDSTTLEDSMQVNFRAPLQFLRHFVPAMRNQGRGHVINICSVASREVLPGVPSYSISKIALYALTDAIRQEVRQSGVKVCAILPGSTYSASWAGADVDPEDLIDPAQIATAAIQAVEVHPTATIEEILIRPTKGNLYMTSTMRIVITGASRGIGYDSARAIARSGDHQLLALSRNTERLAQLKTQIAEESGRDCLEYLAFDLSHMDTKALDQAVEKMGGVDVLINNAGVLINRPFAELSDQDWTQLFEVNFFGAVRLTRHLLPALEQSDQAHVLNISSMGGYQGASKFPGLGGYSCAKGALSILTEVLAEELKEQQIKVNCLALGAVQTEMLEEAFPGMQAPVACQDMGDFISYFCQQGQQFFNGKILPVSVSTP